MKKHDIENTVISYKFSKIEDERWVIEAFDARSKPLGTKILVKDEDEAIKVFMLLNGKGLNDDVETIRQHLYHLRRMSEMEKTQEIDLEKLLVAI